MKVIPFVNQYEMVFKVISFLMLLLFSLDSLGIIQLDNINRRLSIFILFFLFFFFIIFFMEYIGAMFSFRKLNEMFTGIKIWTVVILICSIVMNKFSSHFNGDSFFYSEKNNFLITLFEDFGTYNLLLFSFNLFAIAQLFLIKRQEERRSHQ